MRNLFARFRSTSTSPLESELRAARPQPPEQLVDSIVARVSSRSGARPARLRLAFAGGLTVALVAVAGATGGLSYAATAIAHVASAVKITSAKQSPHVVVAACSQYAVAPIVTGISPNYGQVGDSVTISGSNFSAPSTVTGVTFTGGYSASFVVNSDTQLTATVPLHAKTGPITVSNCKGSSSSGTFTVYYKSPCVVPNVVGLRLKVAKQQIHAAHCGVGRITYSPKKRPKHPTHIYWYVASQNPAPGSVRPHNYPVSLTTVGGP